MEITRWIIDSFHYIGLPTSDVLCCTQCNLASRDGSQPDLVIEEVNAQETVVQKRAFNTEAVKQLNAVFDGFKGSLNWMTDYNFGFMVHFICFLCGEDWRWKKTQEDRLKA